MAKRRGSLEAGINKVIVRVVDSHLDGNFVVDVGSQNWSVRGEVIAPGRRVNNQFRIGYTKFNQLHYFGEYPPYDELYPGEQILIDYTAFFESPSFDGYHVIPYDRIIGVHREAWKGVNGWTLLLHDDSNEFGDPNTYYEGVTPDGIHIGYSGKKAVRIELDLFNTLTNRRSSLFKIRSRYVFRLQ